MKRKAADIIQQFLQSLRVERRLSDNTLSAYQRDLSQLESYCQQQKITDWPKLVASDVRKFIAQRHRQGLGSRSLQRELSACRSFFSYLNKIHYQDSNPAQGIKAPKAAKKLPYVLDVDQLNGLLETVPTDDLETRDLAMWELLYSSGLRLSELVYLDVTELDLIAASVFISHGKGNKSRVLPVGSKAISALKSWLNVRGNIAKPEEKAVFVSKKGTRLSARSIQSRLERWGKRQGLQGRLHPHMLRHSFASHMLESSQDLRGVQELLGHSNISTTQVYTHLDFQHLASVYDQAHPRAKQRRKKDS